MAFVTQNDLDAALTWPVALPQTEIQAGETLMLTTLELGRQDRADLAWLSMHLVKTSPSVRSSLLSFSSQLSTTVTASSPVFLPQDVGSTIRWDTGIEDTITAYTSPSVVTVANSRTLGPTYFSVIGSRPALINSSFGLVYVGLYTEKFYRLDAPGAVPIFYLSLDNLGATALPPRARRIVYGPDIVSVAVTNNTTNVDLVEVTVSGAIKLNV